ncbi:MAG TPA: hypothetical protein VJH63_04225 [Candidatus Paceibacterota bacterium]
MSHPFAEKQPLQKLYKKFPGFELKYSNCTDKVCRLQVVLPDGQVCNVEAKTKHTNHFDGLVALLKRTLRQHYRGGPGKIKRQERFERFKSKFVTAAS